MENKIQKSLIKTNIACSYGYKLVFVDGKFSKTFKPYLRKDSVYNFINCIAQESKYCSEVMKKAFNIELVRTNEDNENFKNSTKSWICDNDCVDNDVMMVLK